MIGNTTAFGNGQPNGSPNGTAARPTPVPVPQPPATYAGPSNNGRTTERQDRPIRGLRRFFPWLAGADPEILKDSKEQLFFSLLGASLLIPFTLSTIGIAVLLHTMTGTTDRVQPWFVVAGVIWGVLVVIVDRLLLKPRYNARDLRHPEQSSVFDWAPKVVIAILRVGLAIALALVVSRPLVALMFSEEVERAVELEATTNFQSDRDKAIAEIEQRRDDSIARLEPSADSRSEQTETEIARLQNEINAASTAYANQVDLCAQEQVNGNGNDRGGGFGPVATQLCAQVPGLKATLDQTKQTNEPILAGLRSELDQVNAPIQQVVDEANQAIAALPTAPEPVELGLWDRIDRAQEEVDAGWLYGLEALLVLLDSLPVLAKVLWGQRAHDRIQARQASESYTQHLIESEQYVRLLSGTQSVELDFGDGEVSPHQAGSNQVGQPSEPNKSDIDLRGDSRSVGIPNSAELLTVAGRLIRITGQFENRGGFGWIRSGQLERRAAGDVAADHGVAVKVPLGGAFAGQMLSNEIKVLNQFAGSLTLTASPLLTTAPDDLNHPVLVTEFFPRTSLDQWLLKGTNVPAVPIPAWLLLGWLANIVDALAELWTVNLVHGDGKPTNLLVVGPAEGEDVDFIYPYLPKAPGSLVLCDFGSAGQEGQPVKTYVDYFTPPEYYNGAGLSRLGDVYSFLGATGHWLAHLSHPGGEQNHAVPDEINQLLATWLSGNPRSRVLGTQERTSADDLARLLREQIDLVHDSLKGQGIDGQLLHAQTVAV
ncbi:MAG: DUF4407 domain-containing protein [Acidimicrobiales bacterium]